MTEDSYFDADPLPEIPSGLLNSQEIREYADKFGLLVSNFEEDRLKSASYEMRFLGDLYLWQLEGKKYKLNKWPVITDGTITLPSNSITYLSLKEEFRLPHYFAARFNLHIRHVHKGLLLGTGPLVDPGFIGHLFIPLHNLTETDYKINGGEGLIWVEFTKLNKPAERKFPKDKLNLTPMEYFDRAGVIKEGGVVSSLKATLDETKAAAAKSQALIDRVKKWSIFGGVVGVIALGLGVGALLVSAYQLNVSAQQIATGASQQLRSAQRMIDEGKTLQAELEHRVSAIQEQELVPSQDDIAETIVPVDRSSDRPSEDMPDRGRD